MQVVSRRNMLALPVERLVGNNHNNSHNHHSSRLSLSPDSNASDSSSTGESSSISIDSRCHNRSLHHHHPHHPQQQQHRTTEGMDMIEETDDMTIKMSPRETSNYSPPNCKMHVLMKSQSQISHDRSSSSSSSNCNLKISSSSSPSSCPDQYNDKEYEETTTTAGVDYHNNQISNRDCNRESYYNHHCHNLKNRNTKRSRSRSPNDDIKNASSRRTCCNSPLFPISLVRDTVVKSEVDMDDRLAKKEEPFSLSMSTEATTNTTNITSTIPIHFPLDDKANNNNNKLRSDKFDEEKSANANNSSNNNRKYGKEIVDDEKKYDTKDEADNRLQVNNNATKKSNRTSGDHHRVSLSGVPISTASQVIDEGDMDINVDGDDIEEDEEEDFPNSRTDETNNSSIDNNNEDHHHHHNHNQHNNHYPNQNSDNNNTGRPPSRPPSSTSTSSSSNCFKSQHFPTTANFTGSNSHFLKFSIEDILRPDFGINNSPNSQIQSKFVSHHFHRQKGQLFSPYLVSPSPSESNSRILNQKWNNHSNNNNNQITNNKELLSPSSLSIASSQRTRTGSVSSTDGLRPYRPSSVHCHSEDSNSSFKREPEVVDDTKVNPPVPKGPLLWPAWVYCTRYSDRPSSGPRSRRIRKSPKEIPDEKRPRTAFTAEQLSRLKQEFDENRYLTEKRRQDLAVDLKLHENQIKIWFQNKRAKLKKSTGTKNGLALQLMAQGLYNHSTVPIDEDDEMEMMM